MGYDVIIKNGYIVDGTGKKPFYGDVALKNGRIAAIGEVSSYMGEEILDAKKQIVSPGFIDAHAHSEISILKHPSAIHKISQGITLEITGHCGDSCFPCQSPGERSFRDLTSYRDIVMRQGMSIDQASMIGHGNLREWVLGEGAEKADADAIAKMCACLETELQAGAAGMSSGLEYAPGMYSDIQEMVPIAAMCRKYQRVYSTHMRSEGSRLLEAVEEALTVAKESGAVTVISHIKACGKPNHGKVKNVVQMMKEANAEGANVYGDCYPYDAGCTGLTIVLPQWTLEKGNQELLRILASEQGREAIRTWFSYGVDVWENRSIVTGWENIFVSHVTQEQHKAFVGKSILDISRMWKKDEIDTLMDLLLYEDGYLPGILRSACEEDVKTAYQYERVMVCSDSVDVEGSPHPRLYGSHTRFLARYADLSTEKGLADSVFRMTGLPAQVYRLHDVGTLEVGKRANLAIWNPAEICDTATFAEPRQLSKGVEAVFVGGKLSYRDNEVIPVRTGNFYYVK